VPEPVAEPWPQEASPPPRFLRIAVAVLVLGLIGYGVGRLVHGLGRTHAAPALSTTITQAPAAPPVRAKPKPTRHQLARVAAVKLAAKLPVSLESAALLSSGGMLYVVGGTPRRGGQPTDGVLQVELATGHVRSAGHFIEPLAAAGSASQGGFLYLAGGWTGEKVATAVLRWSPGKTAALVARLPVGLRSATAAFAGGRLYVTGGSPTATFAVDVHAGTVAPAALPAALRKATSNLDYLTKLEASR